MPETVEDDSESIGAPSDDLESAVPDDNKGVKFGWIRGVLVSCAGISCVSCTEAHQDRLQGRVWRSLAGRDQNSCLELCTVKYA